MAEPTSTSVDDPAPRRLRVILGADAVWDALLGLALFLASWPAAAERIGLPVARPWPVFVLLGIGCVGFGVLLARTARSANRADAATVSRAASIGNAAGTIGLIVLLLLLEQPAASEITALVLAAVGCAVFAVLEWRPVRPEPMLPG